MSKEVYFVSDRFESGYDHEVGMYYLTDTRTGEECLSTCDKTIVRKLNKFLDDQKKRGMK